MLALYEGLRACKLAMGVPLMEHYTGSLTWIQGLPPHLISCASAPDFLCDPET